MKNILIIILLFIVAIQYENNEKQFHLIENLKISSSGVVREVEIAIKETTYQSPNNDSDWDYFTQALIFVESSGNPNAVNKYSGAVGIFQILPLEYKKVKGFLHDWNKYNKKQYTTKDLYNVDVQWEIFNYYQDRYNKQRCIEKAIKLHNPRAGSWYRERIINKMNELKNA